MSHLSTTPLLGYRLIGTGPKNIFVIHDYFCDTTTYDALAPYLDTTKNTFCMVDLRGYGRSMHIAGQFTLDEITADLIRLADHLGWATFHAIGHSMSGQFIQYLAIKHPTRVESLIAITPVPANGSAIPKDALNNIKAAAQGDHNITEGIVHWITGGRMGHGFIKFKARRWHEVSTVEARLAYLNLFTSSDFSAQAKGLTTRILIITGEHDTSYSAAQLKGVFDDLYPNNQLEVVPLATHYPMQETPPYLVGLWEKFLE